MPEAIRFFQCLCLGLMDCGFDLWRTVVLVLRLFPYKLRCPNAQWMCGPFQFAIVSLHTLVWNGIGTFTGERVLARMSLLIGPRADDVLVLNEFFNFRVLSAESILLSGCSCLLWYPILVIGSYALIIRHCLCLIASS